MRHISTWHLLLAHTCVVIGIWYICLYMPHYMKPTITISQHGVLKYHGASYAFDRRMIDLIQQHHDYFTTNLPERLYHRYRPESYTTATEMQNELTTLRDAISRGEYATIDIHAERLKDDNFDYATGTGMLILRLRRHPFVIKLFIERPETVLCSYGWEPYFLMHMNGGINRHISGITRIATNYALKQFFTHHADQYPNFNVPRCWSWVPSNTPWLSVTLYENNTSLTTQIPCVYALINDSIVYAHEAENTDHIFQLFKETDNLFDPHEGNCVIDRYTGEYIILDTEHFLHMTGFTPPLPSTSYPQWYIRLGTQCLKHILLPQVMRTPVASEHVQSMQ